MLKGSIVNEHAFTFVSVCIGVKTKLPRSGGFPNWPEGFKP